jgi:hypothetical protein
MYRIAILRDVFGRKNELQVDPMLRTRLVIRSQSTVTREVCGMPETVGMRAILHCVAASSRAGDSSDVVGQHAQSGGRGVGSDAHGDGGIVSD